MGSIEPTARGITVFCGSSSGDDPMYERAAKEVGVAIAKAGLRLIYGGGTKGLMGAVSTACLEAGGQVHGIIPVAFLAAEAPPGSIPTNPRFKETNTASMHERKQIMASECDAFIGLPGGFGTLEECAEASTWTQLGIPVMLLNVNDFYSPLRSFIQGAVSSKFIAEVNKAFMIFVDRPTDADEAFNWGDAALTSIREWEAAGMGGGQAYSLEWPEQKRAELL
ncbi:BZ3500_MvSof-1268-A1-R1_Chr1-3g02014 [Microbotryum saponariae]|uniref:BZ3500_MvSof-1268-A1-R1_Chr1-3g02014 protein n=1 Tax=Microbotryum saponariae TaxID=289078 RepID=A0A2X0KDJ5_9BASI|nr:BZ3500_MvSof-1268-A1-R1_Chr1-3g02014 [Microbotryum saponariae]SCZ95159.1 BZ3501_MvSof-1269-A2-R1_Chr1-3g01616 [Microbotryum saponariae]